MSNDTPYTTSTFTVRKPGRLDKAMAAQLPAISRSAAQRLIEQGLAMVNDVARDASFNLKPGDMVRVNMPAPQPSAPQPEAIALDVLYEDDDVIAIAKPAGMVVHPGAGNRRGTLVSAVLHHAPGVEGVGDEERPGIVHRLDKETSGIVLVAKTDAALKSLQEQFKSRTIQKTYVALCVGRIEPPRGVIAKPIGRDPAHRQRMAVVADGREATTEYVLSDVFEMPHERAKTRLAQSSISNLQSSIYSLVRAHPLTGRTHQLRVHFASVGNPIVGDELYGATRRDELSQRLAPRHMLHASELHFHLPGNGREMRLHARLPDDFLAVLAELTGNGSPDGRVG